MSSRLFKSRRYLLKALGLTTAALPFFSLVNGRLSSALAATKPKATLPWLSGSTELIKTSYPDTSLFENATACNVQLTRHATEGPCYLGVENREDISLGFTGLPMMLCLQLVDTDCKPLQGYLIEVWHCDVNGIYSGDESNSDEFDRFASRMCTRGDAAGEGSTWYRGEQTTDSNGRVNFKTCFPGWYPGRAIHIHFRVRKEPRSRDYVVSQFCFDDDFCDEICTTHSLYQNRGPQDTPLGRDGVFRSGHGDYVMHLAQNTDGSLLGYKKITIAN